MNAVDTNILVRFLKGDDPNQAEVACSVFASGGVWIAKTVLLETHWVLGGYDMDPESIRAAFVELLGLENVVVEDAPAVAAALALTDDGIDFADALHLCSRPAGTAFISFDRRLIKGAQRCGLKDVLHPTVTKP